MCAAVDWNGFVGVIENLRDAKVPCPVLTVVVPIKGFFVILACLCCLGSCRVKRKGGDDKKQT